LKLKIRLCGNYLGARWVEIHNKTTVTEIMWFSGINEFRIAENLKIDPIEPLVRVFQKDFKA